MPATAERLEILDLLARYCFAIDEHDLAGVEACFTTEATFDIKSKDPNVAGLRSGSDNIAAFMSSTWPDQIEQPRHLILNVVFDNVSADRAEIRAYLLLTFTGDDDAYVAATGSYRSVLVKHDDVWRIRTHELALDASRST